jgi:hypothetical protein
MRTRRRAGARRSGRGGRLGSGRAQGAGADQQSSRTALGRAAGMSVFTAFERWWERGGGKGVQIETETHDHSGREQG